MKELSNSQNAVFRFGAILFVLGLIVNYFLPFVGMVCYVVGILAFTSMQMLMRYDGDDITLRRLRRQQVLSDFCFLLSAAAMVMQVMEFGPFWARHQAWMLCLAIGCVLQLYTAFRIPAEMEKQMRKNDKTKGGISKCVILMLGFLPALMQSCATHYNVEGSTDISQFEGKTLYLRTYLDDAMKSVDSCRVQHGRIHFSGPLDSTQMVNIFVGEESVIPMVLEEGFINLTINDLKQNVTGSPMNDTLYNFIHSRLKIETEFNQLPNLESKLIMDGVEEDERNRILYAEGLRLATENDRLTTSFIIRNSDNCMGPGVFMIMTSAYPYPQLTPQIEEILFRAKPYFKQHPYVKRYLEAAEQNMEKMHNGEE